MFKKNKDGGSVNKCYFCDMEANQSGTFNNRNFSLRVVLCRDHLVKVIDNNREQLEDIDETPEGVINGN